MKVFLDSNVLISAGVFRSKAILNFLDFVENKHEIILSESVIRECLGVVKTKMPLYEERFCEFLNLLDYEQVDVDTHGLDVRIRDTEDKHVVLSALQSGADVLVTGDKDFFDYDYDIEVLTPADFLLKYK